VKYVRDVDVREIKLLIKEPGPSLMQKRWDTEISNAVPVVITSGAIGKFPKLGCDG
jgi:hypothetical protein